MIYECGKRLLWASAFALFAVPAFAGFKVTASSAAPSAVSKGQTVALSAQVQSSAYAPNMIVDLELYNAAGAKVGQLFSGKQTFRSRPDRSLQLELCFAGDRQQRQYTFKIGVFTAAWSSLALWDNSAATFSLSTRRGGRRHCRGVRSLGPLRGVAVIPALLQIDKISAFSDTIGT
jgi:hypothetical protein